MYTETVNVLCSIIATIICDAVKHSFRYRKNLESKINQIDIEKYILNELYSEYTSLFDSGIFVEFLKNPLINDTLSNYILYVVTGNINASLSKVQEKNKTINENVIKDFLTNNLYTQF